MSGAVVRTRFAPSPTGYIHIGNLRTALYSYLISKKSGGKFVLRIEDTDQNRSRVEYEEYIFKALRELGICWDEGVDVGGEFGPYRQSERKDIYIKYAKELVERGFAYYCFCEENNVGGYNGHCRNLSSEEVEKNLKEGKSYVIRQKIPKDENVIYFDKVYGKLEFDTNVLDDQILIKSDGYPTYNFANVIDDHLMKITHIVRGNEYLSSTPKYVLLYKSFGWDVPNFIHLPIINIIDKETNEERKLSKRDGCSSFDSLIKKGYLSEAIINYIMFLGWNPKNNNEFFTLKQLENIFSIKQINKSTSVLFDENKLNWYNQQYIKKLDNNTFIELCNKWTNNKYSYYNWNKIIPFIKGKINTLNDIEKNVYYVDHINPYSKELLFNYDKAEIKEEYITNFKNYLNNILKQLNNSNLTSKDYYNLIKEYSEKNNIPFGINMHLFRVFMSGLKDVLITGVDIAELIGLNKVIERINFNK